MLEKRRRDDISSVEGHITQQSAAAVETTCTANDSFFHDQSNYASDPTRMQWMKLGESTLDFWNADGEDIYTASDGNPT